MVTIIILASTMVGTSIEDALNPRLKVGHLSVRRFRLRPLDADDVFKSTQAKHQTQGARVNLP
jgi:hypothetical protein